MASRSNDTPGPPTDRSGGRPEKKDRQAGLDAASAVADVDQPDPGEVNPLAPPINIEAGA